MRFNLKNFPIEAVRDCDYSELARDIIKWFEGFEAELREIGMLRITNQCCKETLQDMIEEILGE